MRKGFAPEVDATPTPVPPTPVPDAEVVLNQALDTPALTGTIADIPDKVRSPPPWPLVSAEAAATATEAWIPVVERWLQGQEILYDDRRRYGRQMPAFREFAEWLGSFGFTREQHPPVEELIEKWTLSLGFVDGARPNINQLIRRKAAHTFFTEEDNMRNNRPLPQRAAPPPVEDSGLVDDDEDDDDDAEEGQEAADEVEAQPPRAKTPRQPAPQPMPMQQPVYVMQPGMMPGMPYPGQPPYRNKGGRPITNPNNPNYQGPRPMASTAVSRLLPKNEKIRIFKRGLGGKKTYVQDYTVDEIGGGSLHKFLKEYVTPAFGDASGVTVYEVYEVGPDDKERGQPSSITIEDEPMDAGNDPISHARSALSFIEEVREMEENRHGTSRDVLDEMKRKAANGGDMNNMMMLMMMERLMGGGSSNPEALALKLVERLQGAGGGVPLQPLPLGPPPTSSLDKMMEVLLASALKPPPPPKTLMEQMTEMKLMREIFAPPPTSAVPPELIQLLARMNEKLDKPRGGIEEALGTFDKLTGVVKQLAPQVNMGGITGALQSILTPELGKAVGGMLAGGIAKAQESVQSAAKGAPSTTAPRLPANATPVAPVTANPNPEPPPVPEAIQAAAKKLHEEKDETKARIALTDLLQAMYAEPTIKPRLDEVLGAVLTGDYKPAKAALKDIVLSAQRPDLDNEMFIDRTIALLVTNAGGTPPDELLHKAPVVPIRGEAVQNIPTVAESEALEEKERAARDAKAKADYEAMREAAAPAVPVNGTPVEVTKFEKSTEPAQTQPSSIA